MKSDQYRQRIPRPAGARISGPPPWSGAPADAPDLTVDQIATILDPVESARIPPSAIAAVLVPLVQRTEGLAVLLIRRAESLSKDPGLIAFPGGRRDGDESYLATALRETEEEIGLDRRSITVLGALTPATRGVDGVTVAAFVGVVEDDPIVVLNPHEVETVIEVPIAALFAGGVAWEEIWSHGEQERSIHFFADDALLGDDLMWGLSARILWDLLHRIWIASRAA
jgi:8-oxo-dGTP pyrophosphatase MutT (NUDIX family)